MSKTAAQIRQSFLSFFEQNGHAVVRSSPLVPENDPTLLFTNAGMVQFKDVFTGRETRAYRRATTSQKCVRAGGKHNDLENVGRTARHHTFFEMLGNFSFGDYFKEEAIAFAWDWLVNHVKLDPARMIFTVFEGEPGIPADDEALALWKKVAGQDADVRRLGNADNFWMMGDTGPQGPCSEIHYWVGDVKDLDHSRFGQEPGPDGAGWVEIWNLVFMQFEKASKDAALQPLPRPSIDTGAGLERVAAVVQGQRSNYDTDLLRELVEYAGDLAKKKYDASTEDGVSMRVLADHARAATFLIGDGVMPSNEGRGYVLRRIMRRAIRHGVRLGLGEGAYRQICERVIATMHEAYPDLDEARSLIGKVVDAEDGAFRRTIDRGLKLLDEELASVAKQDKKIIAGPVAFRLYDTFGFPLDLTQVIAGERGVGVDEVGFEAEMDKQRQRSEDFGGSGEKAIGNVEKQLRAEVGETEFTGYDVTEGRATVRGLLVDGATSVRAVHGAGRVVVVVDRSPFYGESGGQVGDAGSLVIGDHVVDIIDTQKVDGMILHHLGSGAPTLSVGDTVELRVDVERRNRTRANHSATHLLHLALKEVLGTHVAQKGSLVGPERLRFDFAHFSPLSDEEKQRIEAIVNREVLANLPAECREMGYDEARASGAVALFGEKYGDRVRVMKIGARSVELCGGTHVQRTGDIGLFKLLSDQGIAQGVRRVEAVTGWNAVKYVDDLERELGRASASLRSPMWSVAEQVDRLQKELKERERTIEALQKKLAMGSGRDILASVRQVAGVKVLATRSEVGDPKALRDVADQLRQKLGSGVIVLGGVADGKVALVAAVSADLVGRFQAGKLIGELSKIVGGKGGGKPDFAQGGGSDAGRLDEALAAVDKLIG